MKSKIIFRATTAMLVFFFIQNSFGQVTKVDTLNEVVIRSNSLVNKAVAKAFTTDFKNALSPRWYKMDQNYVVKFMTVEQRNSALYNKKGNLIYHIGYLVNTVSMPNDIRGFVNEKYPDSKILTAIHVSQDARSIWIVNLKEGAHLVLARVEEEQVEEIQRITDISL
ncbi:hypothetical protein [Mucilaginibacter gotjawali]|uniref:Uncharacterized protein n=2 Tax=Mucilaginibacter gotjawali TaxID=1550579 RepID=A0A0X8X355_9SPHI|nr:hypothetical protein [Mucilaginibacter gotjawali]MBB3058205.1 hypothetical protein [Mucilaginibacter gotjawali]BAU54839.1 hypothetical protein MgSA37_03018 [Mucilaginibacter gotjawali]